MIFFGDENIPPAACRMLNAFDAENDVIHLSDEFETGTQDTDWLIALGDRSERRVILTRDAAMLRRPEERKILQANGGHIVVLSSGFNRLGRDDLLIAFVRGWRPLVQQIERLKLPTILRWYHRGNKRVVIEGRLTPPKSSSG